MDKHRKHLTDEAFRLIAARFRVLSDAMRLKIIHCLQDREHTVTELIGATGGEQANVSKHLGILLANGLVNRRREGTSAFYSVVDPAIFDLCRNVCSSLGEQLASDQDAIRSFSRNR